MTDFLLIGGLGMGEILLIVVLVLLLFGAKRIPELMKGFGKGIRSFKDGLNSSDVDDAVEKSDDDKK